MAEANPRKERESSKNAVVGILGGFMTLLACILTAFWVFGLRIPWWTILLLDVWGAIHVLGLARNKACLEEERTEAGNERNQLTALYEGRIENLQRDLRIAKNPNVQQLERVLEKIDL